MFRSIMTRTTTTMYHHRQLPNATSSTTKLLDYQNSRRRLYNNRRLKSSQPQSTESSSHHYQFPTWPTPVIESYGDYRQEKELERTTFGGKDSPLYEHQDSLPRLPVPTVEETLKRFLPTALPLAESKTEQDELLDALDKFPQQSQQLQERLLHRATNEMADSSYLSLWWNTAGYLDVRDPVVINVSYFLHYADDVHATTNIQRGAAMLTAVANFRKDVCSGQLPPETVGRAPKTTVLDSTPYKYMFHACRIPRRNRDSVRIYDPSLYEHVIVSRKGHFYAVDFVDKETGDALPLETLEASLQEVIRAADLAGPPLLNVGYLTSQHRDDWADARQIMTSTRAGEEALELLQQGAILLCLDDVSPVSRQECGTLFWNGSTTGTTASNRWFDKSIQLFCTDNGKAGLLGEHALMDGMPAVRLSDTITKTTYQSIVESSQKNTSLSNNKSIRPIRNIFQTVLPEFASELKPHVDKAKQEYDQLTSSHELQVQSFQRYGATYMKQSGFSPDAYVQMAMQLATYRLWDGKCGGTYEATQTRPFLHGRTETTRSVSPASVEFCQAMGVVPFANSTTPKAATANLDLFRNAINTHVTYIKNAAKGFGVDRHFLGLAMLVKDDEQAPDLFQTALYQRSKTWRVSTSHLTHPNFDNWGYGEVVPDGVGLAYGIKPESCVFNVTALKKQGFVEPLCHHLEKALLEIQTMIEMEKAANQERDSTTPPKSRL